MLPVPDAERLEALALDLDGRARRWGWTHAVVREATAAGPIRSDLLARCASTQTATTAVEIHGVAALDAVADRLARLWVHDSGPGAVTPNVGALRVAVLVVDWSGPAVIHKGRPLVW